MKTTILSPSGIASVSSRFPGPRLGSLPRAVAVGSALALSAWMPASTQAAPDATPDAAISGDMIAPTGIAFGSNGKVFISEYQNGNELHIWPSIANWTSGANAEQSFAATTGESVAVSADSTRVAVSLTEGGSFINVYTTLGDNHYGFLKQFGGNNAVNPGDPGGTSTVNASSLAFNRGLRWQVSNGLTYLWVADDAFNRILRFSVSAINLQVPPQASVVLGAPNFTTRGSLAGVKDIEFDAAGNLYAVSYDGKKIMRFDQPFASGTVVPSRTWTLPASPVNLAFSGTTLYTSMPAERKVWAFDNIGSRASGALSPSLVLGADDGALRLGGNFGPQGLAFDPIGNLYVCDLDNNRVVRFDNVFPVPTVKVKGKARLTTPRPKITVRGTATGATRVEVQVGKKKYKAATLTAAGSWKFVAKLATGRNVIKVRAAGLGGSSKVSKVIVVRR